MTTLPHFYRSLAISPFAFPTDLCASSAIHRHTERTRVKRCATPETHAIPSVSIERGAEISAEMRDGSSRVAPILPQGKFDE